MKTNYLLPFERKLYFSCSSRTEKLPVYVVFQYEFSYLSSRFPVFYSKCGSILISNEINGNIQKQLSEVSNEKGVPKNFTFTGKHPCPSLFLNKAVLIKARGSATLLIKRLWHRCFCVNFVKLLIIPFSQNTCANQYLTSQ